jgi:Ca2+-binding RTX toxin-like protein
VRFDRVEPAPFFLDLGTCESLLVHCHGGDDRFAATGNLAALIGLTIDGGPGRDTLLGGNGPDLLRGGEDNDFIDGNQGGDVILLGAGDDTFQWDPGDGSDTVEGQAGRDTLSFNGSNIGEIFDFSANVARLRLTRNVGNIVMDGDGLEQVRLNTLGGADFINVHDLTGTSVADVSLSLASPLGSNTGDGSADNVIVKGTSDDDSVTVAGDTNSILVLGLHAVVTIAGHEAARDLLSIHTLAGEDLVDASTLAAGAIGFAADGGDHDDVLIGSAGVDVLFGGEGDDVLLGGPGADALDGGPGNNVVIQD